MANQRSWVIYAKWLDRSEFCFGNIMADNNAKLHEIEAEAMKMIGEILPVGCSLPTMTNAVPGMLILDNENH